MALSATTPQNPQGSPQGPANSLHGPTREVLGQGPRPGDPSDSGHLTSSQTTGAGDADCSGPALLGTVFNLHPAASTAARANGHPRGDRRRDLGLPPDSASTVLSSELESSSFIDSDEEDNTSRWAGPGRVACGSDPLAAGAPAPCLPRHRP